MGWTPVKLPAAKPTVAGLGPYREAAPSTDAAALVRPWRYTTTGRLGFFTVFAILWNGVCAIILSKESMHHDASGPQDRGFTPLARPSKAGFVAV